MFGKFSCFIAFNVQLPHEQRTLPGAASLFYPLSLAPREGA